MRRVRLALLAPVLLLAACSSDPVLVSGDDVDGATRVVQNTGDALAPGWTWCQPLSPGRTTSSPIQGSLLELEDGSSVGATIMQREDEGITASELLEKIQAQADLCINQSETASAGESFEPLDGLADDARGWRSETPEGRWGEYVVVQLDEWRVLAYGFATDEEDPPIDLDELGDLAREGAARFPSAEG